MLFSTVKIVIVDIDVNREIRDSYNDGSYRSCVLLCDCWSTFVHIYVL